MRSADEVLQIKVKCLKYSYSKSQTQVEKAYLFLWLAFQTNGVIKEQLRASFLRSALFDIQCSHKAILSTKEKLQEITKANGNVYPKATFSRETIYTCNAVDVIWRSQLSVCTAFPYDTGMSKTEHTEISFWNIRAAK